MAFFLTGFYGKMKDLHRFAERNIEEPSAEKRKGADA
jgi:hypothetical protein